MHSWNASRTAVHHKRSFSLLGLLRRAKVALPVSHLSDPFVPPFCLRLCLCFLVTFGVWFGCCSFSFSLCLCFCFGLGAGGFALGAGGTTWFRFVAPTSDLRLCFGFRFAFCFAFCLGLSSACRFFPRSGFLFGFLRTFQFPFASFILVFPCHNPIRKFAKLPHTWADWWSILFIQGLHHLRQRIVP